MKVRSVCQEIRERKDYQDWMVLQVIDKINLIDRLIDWFRYLECSTTVKVLLIPTLTFCFHFIFKFYSKSLKLSLNNYLASARKLIHFNQSPQKLLKLLDQKFEKKSSDDFQENNFFQEIKSYSEFLAIYNIQRAQSRKFVDFKDDFKDVFIIIFLDFSSLRFRIFNILFQRFKSNRF